MEQKLRPTRRAAGLLIAAAALPLSPLLAQDVQAPNAPPPTPQSATPPPAEQAPVTLPATPAPTVAPAPAPVPPVAVAPPAASTAAPRARTAARAPVRSPASFATASRATRTTRITPVRAAAPPPPIAATPAPAPVAVSTAPAPTVTPAPEPAPVTSTSTTTTTTARPARSFLPWLAIALLVLGVAAFALLRRRRRVDVYDEGFVPAAEPVAAVPPVAAAESGRPWLDLALEPVRAGVKDDEAVVEFALRVDNHGVAPARDVRVSAFMLQAGASEAERNLIQPKAMPPVEIAPGETKQVETAVALPTDKVEGDSVLPVVVADARYTLPDGSEGHTSATFAVGVPDGEELAHFAVDNPSGLHDDVVARPLGEMEKA